MKKYLSILFALILFVSLTACTGKDKKANSEKIVIENATFNGYEDAFPQGTQLEIYQLQNGVSYETSKIVLDHITDNFVIYDITATNKDQAVEPDSIVEVTLPIPKDFKTDKLSVMHVTHDGAIEEVDYKANKDAKSICITISKMGLYAIIQPKETTSETSSDECLHAFIDATCTTPKMCDKCKLTEGNALGHDFSEGICTRCNTKETN